MYQLLFIHLLVNGCFPSPTPIFLAIINKAAVKIPLYNFPWVCLLFLLGRNQSGWLAQTVSICLSL